MSKKTRVLILTFGIVLLGFLREYLFVNINWIYLTLTNGRMNAARPEFQFLIDWSPAEINALKWILTLLFSFLFFGITFFIIKLHFQSKTYNQITALMFAGMLIIALLLFAIGKLTGQYETLYGPIHTIMSMVQSFMPLMILFLLFSFLPHTKSN